MAPPTVTNRVPGVTGRNQPLGTNSLRISDKSTPASHLRMPLSSSKAMNRFRGRVSMSTPPSFWQLSP